MNKKLVSLTVLPALALTFVGTGAVSAFDGGERGSATPKEKVERLDAMFEKKAELFGLDVGSIKTAWAEGKTMEELAEEHGIDLEALRAQHNEQRKIRRIEHINILVAECLITQAQADARFERIEQREAERAERIANGEEVKRPKHRKRGKHRRGGFGF